MSIPLPGIDSEEALGTPSVEATVHLPGIASVAALGTPAVSVKIYLSGIASEEALGNLAAIFNYEGSGEVIISGEAESRFRIFIPQEFTWNFLDDVAFEKSFQWNTGEQQLHWYRVQGCCTFPTKAGSGIDPFLPGGCDVMNFETDDDKCKGALGKQQFIQNILARDLHDLCLQIEKGKMRWEICSIKKYSQSATGPSDDCNTLTTIPFEDVPECLPFAVHTTGYVNIGAHASVIDVIYHAVGDGGVEIGGEAETRIVGEEQPTTGSFNYEAEGGVEIGGEAEAWSSWSDILQTNIGAHVSIEGLEAVFDTDPVDVPALIPPTNTVDTQCGFCDAMPLLLYMKHNLTANGGVLVDFLQRNGFRLPPIFTMHYSRRLQSWTANYHLTGIGADNLESQENWRFIFEWACLKQIAGDDLASASWKFSMFVGRSNPNNDDNFDTRLLIVFPPEQICAATQSFGFDLPFAFNTTSQHVKTDINVVINTLVYSDKIGLFKASGWVQKPDFRVFLSKSNADNGVQYQDIYPIFPPQPLTIQ